MGEVDEMSESCFQAYMTQSLLLLVRAAVQHGEIQHMEIQHISGPNFMCRQTRHSRPGFSDMAD